MCAWDSSNLKSMGGGGGDRGKGGRDPINTLKSHTMNKVKRDMF